MTTNYRPPMSSDSESDYDGFYDDFEVKERPTYIPAVVSKETQMSTAIADGDLDRLKIIMAEIDWDVKKLVDNEMTLLQLAAVWGQLDIVKYLVLECEANVNFTRKSLPPLLLACQSIHKPQEMLVEVVKFLIENEASLKATDQYQTTGLMFAAAKGYTLIIRCWVEQKEAIDTRDYNGDTALYHAIEHNQTEAVKLLMELGADANIVNYKEYSPAQVAQFYGFTDLMEILPKPLQTYTVPCQFTTYNTLRDYIPQIFLKSDCPQYFQEVADILRLYKKPNYLAKFAQAGVSLETFLNLDEQDLIDLGFHLPVHRMCIKRILLRFFLGHWEKEKDKSASFARALRDNNFHNILLMTASHLKQLVVLRCAMRYIRHNMEQNVFGSIHTEDLYLFQKSLIKYQNSIKDAQSHAAYLASFSPTKNPLYINYEEFLITQKREKQIRATFKKTVLIVGISVIIYFRLRKFLN